MKASSNLSRRDILRSGGALIIGFVFRASRRANAAEADDAETKFAGKPVDGTEVDSFPATKVNLQSAAG